MQRHLCRFLALCFAAVPSLFAINAAITGVVMTGDGVPVAGARVSLRTFETSEGARVRLLSATPETAPLASTQTDSKGTFSLESPKEPTVDLTIYKPGHAPQSRRVERDEDIGALVLAKAETRKGSVTAAGKPVANALVAINFGGYEYIAHTDEQGRYEAPDPKRASSIAVVHPDFAPQYETFVTMSGVSASALHRTLAPGSTFKGTVTNDKNAPVAKATVLVDNWPVATTGDDGTFTIAHMPSKWSALTARKDNLLGQRTFSKETTATLRLVPAAVISGRVLDAKSRTPIAGALVRTTVRRFGPGGLDNAISTLTDAKGTYSAMVAPGTYTVFTTHPGYDARPLDVNAAAGQHVAKDISLSALGRVSGLVLDEEKRPVVVATVDTETADTGRFGMPRMMMRGGDGVVSGPDGRFTIRILPDEALSIRATKRGFPTGKSDQFAVNAGERKAGVVITIPSGIAVSGRVVDANNSPLSGVSVTPNEVEGGQRGMMMRTFIGGMPSNDEELVLTASDGTFTTRVKEGTYDFAFRRDGFAPKIVRGQTISVTSSPTIEATMEPAAQIRGRVVRNGAGVENVMIMALTPGTPVANVMTGPDGSFTLDNLAPGSVRLMARKDDDFVNEQRSITAPANDVLIELRTGGRITGRVVEKGSGKPVTTFQAGITTSRGSFGGGMMMMGPPQLRSFTADDGTFTLDNVPAGAMVVMASAPGYASTRLNVNVEEGKEVTGIELQLDLGVKLAGRVTGPNGSPLADVQVRIMPSPTGSFATSGSERLAGTDSNGEYTIEGLEAGEESVSFSHPKYNASRKSVTLKGRETRLDAQLEAGGKFTGTVVTESGSPVADAQVEAVGAGSMDRARTNAHGAFEFTSIAPGRYRITASKTGLVEGLAEDVDVTAGTPVRIVMKSGGTIYGRITGLSASELAQAQVMAGAAQTFSTGTVDAQGNYRIEGVEAGTVQVQAWSGMNFSGSSRRAPSQTVELAPGGSQQLDIAFAGDIVVSGRVLRNGSPVAGGQVMFSPRGQSDRGSGSSGIESDGRYSVSGLQEGEYSITVMDAQRGTTPYQTTHMVRGTETHDIEFRTNALRGRVIDRSTSEPLANVNVALRPSGTTGDGPRFLRSGLTDATGSFLIDSVPSGSYTATATRDGFANETKDVYVSESSTPDLDFNLARNIGVTLSVLDGRDNRPITGRAIAFDAQGRVADETRMTFGGGGDAGNITLNLAPGTYSASVSAYGYAPQTITIQSPGTQTVRLTPGGTVEVHASREGLRVQFLDASGAIYPRYSVAIPARQLLNGNNTFPNMAVGTYTMQILDKDVVVSSKRITVFEGQTVNEDV